MHRTLARQLKRTLGVDEQGLHDVLDGLAVLSARQDIAPAVAGALRGLGDFLARVEDAYTQNDRDLALRTRSLELSSEELSGSNNLLRTELESRQRSIASLRDTAMHLLGESNVEQPAGTEDNLEAIAELMNGLARQSERSRAELKDALAVLDSQKFALDQHAIVSISDPDGSIQYANARFCEVSGYREEELLGKNHRVVGSGMHTPEFFDDLWETIRSGRVWHGEICNRSKNGSLYWVDATIVPFVNDAGQITQYVAIRTDITQRKQMESQIVESEKRFRSVVENLQEVVYRVDGEGCWAYLTPAWEKITGHSIEETLGRRWTDFVHPDDRQATLEFLVPKLSQKQEFYTYQLRIGRKDGGYCWIENHARMEFDDSGRLVETSGTLSDVTERRDALEQLNEQLEFVNELIELVPQPIYMKNVRGRYVLVNRAFERFFGVGRERCLGTTASEFLPAEEANIHGEVDRKLLEKPDTAVYEVLTHAFDGKLRDGIYRKTTLTRRNGSISGILGTITDITDHKRAEAELIKAKDEAEAANRAKSDFLANMSHEIRTPMNGILGMTDLALDTELTEAQREYLQMVRSSADSLLTIINDILDFSKIEAGKMTIEKIDFDLAGVMFEAIKPLSLRATEKGVELVCDIDAEVPRHVTGDPGRLKQIIVNLVGNAIKFTERGEIVLRVRVGEVVGDGLQLCFSVRDTGIGIPRDKQGLIFDAFAQEDTSTTRRFGGTGLGLTICNRLIGMMGGRLWLESEPGVGSTFHFETLFGRGEADSVLPAEPIELAGRRVLVVDDNAVNLAVLGGMLKRWGLSVTTVASGSEALAVLAAEPGIELVMLDAVMPGMDGFETATHMASLRKNPPRLIMLSSSSLQGDARRCLDLGIAAYLPKPIAPDELRRAIARVMLDIKEATPKLITRHQIREEQSALDILLVEDHPVNQKLAMTLIQRLGHRVTLAENGEQAIAVLGGASFDLVLMDVQMPVMDGIEATRRIRAEPIWRDLPIIAMTANAMEGDRDMCIAAGMSDYISKPIKSAILTDMLARYAARACVETSATSPFSYLDALDGVDADVVDIVGQTFLEQYPRDLAELNKAYAVQDAELLARTAHSLKGSVAIFGAEPARASAEAIEQAAFHGDCNAATAALQRIPGQLADLAHALRQRRRSGTENTSGAKMEAPPMKEQA